MGALQCTMITEPTPNVKTARAQLLCLNYLPMAGYCVILDMVDRRGRKLAQ